MRSLRFVFVLLAACGSRTALDLAPAPSASARPVLTGSDGGPLRTDAGVPITVVSTACSDGKKDWLLFTLGGFNGALSAMRADGQSFHKVHLPHTPLGHVSLTPDGTRLLYGAYDAASATVDGGNNSALYLYDLTTHTSTFVVGTVDLTYAALSPDSQTVAYVSGYSVHSVHVDGTNDRELLHGPDPNGTGYGHPTFASDSVTIVYANGSTLGRIHADGTAQEVLLSENAGFLYPNAAFSPDYQTLVVGVACDPSSPQTLSLYPYASLPGSCAQGAVLVDVSDSVSPNAANDPSWGANGLIAYASGEDVFIIPPTGGAAEKVTGALTSNTVGASDPVWVPACATIP